MIDFNKRKMRAWSLNGPSGALGAAAEELGASRDDVFMLTSDLCYFSGLDRFRNLYPDRFINTGIAEQTMVGVAAGLAREGFCPFVNTYASFLTRCADQVRVNMSYMKLPIKFIGLTAGCSNGIMGATHMSIEDIAFMRSLPNISIISPADCAEVVKAIVAVANTSDPTYIRLTGSQGMPMVYSDDYDYIIGKAIKLREGQDVCIIATGSMVHSSLGAAKLLENSDISTSVINMHTVKPLDIEIIHDESTKHKLIVVAEEHNVYGGLYGAIAEYVVSHSISVPIISIGMNDYFEKAGGYSWQKEKYGLTADCMAKRITIHLNSKRRAE